MKKNDFEHFTDLVIGRKPVEELFKTGGKIEKLYILKGGEGSLKQLTAQGREQKIPLFFKEKNFLDRLASGENHQGIIARTGEFSYSSLEDILVFSEKRGEDPFLLILDGIEDPHNLGAIIRSAEFLSDPAPWQRDIPTIMAFAAAVGLSVAAAAPAGSALTRSEERRVGKECRSRWSPYH